MGDRAASRPKAPRIPESAFAQAERGHDASGDRPSRRLSAHRAVWWSVDMAAFARTAPGLRTGRGCIAGVPDMIVLWQGRAFFIAVKASDGALSPAQKDVAMSVALCGCRLGVARDTA